MDIVAEELYEIGDEEIGKLNRFSRSCLIMAIEEVLIHLRVGVDAHFPESSQENHDCTQNQIGGQLIFTHELLNIHQQRSDDE